MKYINNMSPKAFFNFNGEKHIASQWVVETQGDKALEAYLDTNPFWSKKEYTKDEIEAKAKAELKLEKEAKEKAELDAKIKKEADERAAAEKAKVEAKKAEFEASEKAKIEAEKAELKAKVEAEKTTEGVE